MPGPLDGIRVLELGHWVAVPSACVILADWGAEVIKIEDPAGGDAMRGFRSIEGVSASPVHFWFEQINRNKKSVALDLRHEQGRGALYRLAKNSDVLLSNFQVPVLERFGLDYATLQPLNPRLVYGVLTGFGKEGPERDKPGYDYSAFWARGGFMSKIGEPGTPPPPQRPALGDNVTSMLIAGAVSAALLARTRTGVGQELSFSLFNTAVWVLSMDIEAVLAGGVEIPKTDRRRVRNPLWNTYQTRDGRWLQLVMLQSDRFWGPFCQAIGRPDLEGDPRFSSSARREENCASLVSILEEMLAIRDCAQWEETFSHYELIFSRVQSVTEVTQDPQALANGFFTQVAHPACGSLRLVASPARFSATPLEVRSPAPELGQHTEEVLIEVGGYSWEEIGQLREAGAL